MSITIHNESRGSPGFIISASSPTYMKEAEQEDQ